MKKNKKSMSKKGSNAKTVDIYKSYKDEVVDKLRLSVKELTNLSFGSTISDCREERIGQLLWNIHRYMDILDDSSIQFVKTTLSELGMDEIYLSQVRAGKYY